MDDQDQHHILDVVSLFESSLRIYFCLLHRFTERSLTLCTFFSITKNEIATVDFYKLSKSNEWCITKKEWILLQLLSTVIESKALMSGTWLEKGKTLAHIKNDNRVFLQQLNVQYAMPQICGVILHNVINCVLRDWVLL